MNAHEPTSSSGTRDTCRGRRGKRHRYFKRWNLLSKGFKSRISKIAKDTFNMGQN
jgi:hypothetical protein